MRVRHVLNVEKNLPVNSRPEMCATSIPCAVSMCVSSNLNDLKKVNIDSRSVN